MRRARQAIPPRTPPTVARIEVELESLALRALGTAVTVVVCCTVAVPLPLGRLLADVVPDAMAARDRAPEEVEAEEAEAEEAVAVLLLSAVVVVPMAAADVATLAVLSAAGLTLVAIRVDCDWALEVAGDTTVLAIAALLLLEVTSLGVYLRRKTKQNVRTICGPRHEHAIQAETHEKLYTSIYGPPSPPDATCVTLIVCETPGDNPPLENSTAKTGCAPDEVPAEASTRVPDAPSTETRARAPKGLEVACQDICVPLNEEEK